MIPQPPLRRNSRGMRLATGLLAVVVLVPCFLGFGTKFLEFVATFRSNGEGIFVLLPMVNYLLATVGFCFLLGWATMHGMFRDVEHPKFAMLEQEERLDALADEERRGGEDPGPHDDSPPNEPLPWSPDRELVAESEEESSIHGEPVCHV